MNKDLEVFIQWILDSADTNTIVDLNAQANLTLKRIGKALAGNPDYAATYANPIEGVLEYFTNETDDVVWDIQHSSNDDR